MQQPRVTRPGIALAPPLHELHLLDAPLDMLIPLIMLGDGCVRQRDAALAGRVVVAGVEAEVGRQGERGAHGMEQSGRGAAGEVAARSAHVRAEGAVAGKHGRADLVADVVGACGRVGAALWLRGCRLRRLRCRRRGR